MYYLTWRERRIGCLTDDDVEVLNQIQKRPLW